MILPIKLFDTTETDITGANLVLAGESAGRLESGRITNNVSYF